VVPPTGEAASPAASARSATSNKPAVSKPVRHASSPAAPEAEVPWVESR
jgi:hypothetical protein